MTYANGALPASVLGTIPGTFKQILAQLVPQTDALRSAFAAHFGKPLVVTDAYRDLAGQVKSKAIFGVFAATPGTSNHGWGRALDLGSGIEVDGSPESLWMLANAPAYGWTHPAWASDWNPANGQHEPWHWEASVYAVDYPRAVTPTVTGVPTITPPAPLTPKEPDVDLNNPADVAALKMLIAVTLRENIGDVAAADPSSWWFAGVDTIVATSIRKNLGDLAPANSWGPNTLMNYTRAAVEATIPDIAAAIVKALPTATAGTAGGLTVTDVETAVRTVLHNA